MVDSFFKAPPVPVTLPNHRSKPKASKSSRMIKITTSITNTIKLFALDFDFGCFLRNLLFRMGRDDASVPSSSEIVLGSFRVVLRRSMKF